MPLRLSEEEMLRYNRQISIRGFDFERQEKLKVSSVLVVGLGGLGCAAAQYLTASGIGKLTLLDFDRISLSNLQRQILYRDTQIGMAKVNAAKLILNEINPHVQINTINQLLDNSQLADTISQVDLVLDCTDNVDIRNRLNYCCFMQKKTLVSGSAIRMEGQLTVFTYKKEQACYCCLSQLFGDNHLTCAESGVMAPLVGAIGSMQAIETIKALTHFGQNLDSKLLFIDLMTMQFKELQLIKNPNCPVCGD